MRRAARLLDAVRQDFDGVAAPITDDLLVRVVRDYQGGIGELRDLSDLFARMHDIALEEVALRSLLTDESARRTGRN